METVTSEYTGKKTHILLKVYLHKIANDFSWFLKFILNFYLQIQTCIHSPYFISSQCLL